MFIVCAKSVCSTFCLVEDRIVIIHWFIGQFINWNIFLVWSYYLKSPLNKMTHFHKTLQCLRRLSFTWHSLYVDRLYHMLGKLCKYGWWMWLLGRCWWSRATNIIYNGSDCSGTFYCDWDILQCTGSYDGWTKDLAAALSYTCKKDADKSELRNRPLLMYFIISWVSFYFVYALHY